MAVRPVHWHEGMFLRPHHFQAAQRFNSHLDNLSEKWDHHYNWGLRAIDLDTDALANNRLSIRSLQARLRDGTLISVPEDGLLPALDLKPAFERDNTLTVLLGVPRLHVGRANLAGAQAENARFVLDTQELEDENTGVNPQVVQVRLLNLRLLLSNQDQTGYDTVPLARIEKSARAEATPQLDATYIPPVLACDAWKALSYDILQQIYDRLGKVLEQKANQAISRGIAIESQSPEDIRIVVQLRILNEAYALLGVLVFAQGIHPLSAFAELCRLVGQLSIFSSGRRTPELPRYDHDDLGGCFYRIKKYIDALLGFMDKEVGYEERNFVGTGLRMQVAMEPKWLEPAYQMFVGVTSTLQPQDTVRVLTTGGLDMKIGSSERVDEIYRRGLAGLRFQHSPNPPRSLPVRQGLVYFQVNRTSELEEWQNVQKTLTLAVRLNERLIAGNIEGQQELTIKTTGPAATKMRFTLFVLRQES